MKELSDVFSYMDYSFERAFTIQEKQQMLAYKVSNLHLFVFTQFCIYQNHSKVLQVDIDKLKPNPEEIGRQELIKDQKIAMFQHKLDTIKSAALWLDHVTQIHTDDHKERKNKITVIEDNLSFLSEKLMYEKM